MIIKHHNNFWEGLHNTLRKAFVEKGNPCGSDYEKIRMLHIHINEINENLCEIYKDIEGLQELSDALGKCATGLAAINRATLPLWEKEALNVKDIQLCNEE